MVPQMLELAPPLANLAPVTLVWVWAVLCIQATIQGTQHDLNHNSNHPNFPKAWLEW